MSPVKLKIRSAALSDVDAIAGCVELAYQKYIDVIGKKPGPMLANYIEVIRDHFVYVGEFEGRIAGILVLIQQSDGLLLDNVAVHPECQGSGFGGQLVSFAESRALDMGYCAIDLYTHERMVDNITAYQRLGYEEIDRREEQGFSRVYMRKQLN